MLIAIRWAYFINVFNKIVLLVAWVLVAHAVYSKLVPCAHGILRNTGFTRQEGQGV